VAVENTNLLHLLLAYSASHRARLLSHPEPANRIALWVRDVFPSLRHALDDLSNTEISNANLATAIMLASLEIISPSAFGVSVPWQNHLSIARSIIKCRGGGPKSVSRKDPVTFFLTRWLAYLDVLGSLSGRRNEEPLFGGNYWRRSSTAVPLPASELELYGTDDEASPSSPG
jgi:Fungal specific transcription factor domain